jgi:hypothetical protein
MRVDSLAVVDVVGERRGHVGEGEVVIGGDFIRASAEPLVPHRDVLHGDATTTDASLPAGSVRRDLDVVVQRLARHGAI